MTGSTFRIGLVQMRAGRTPSANLEAVTKLIGEAKNGGADYVQTPEMANIMEVRREKLFATIVQCTVTEKQQCNPGQGCQANVTTIAHYIDWDRKRAG